MARLSVALGRQCALDAAPADERVAIGQALGGALGQGVVPIPLVAPHQGSRHRLLIQFVLHHTSTLAAFFGLGDAPLPVVEYQ